MARIARPVDRPTTSPPSRFCLFAALFLLLLFFAQVTTAARQTSLTSDEGPQLTSGYSYLRTGDPHLIVLDGHPPLAKVWAALPLLAVADLGSPDSAPSWASTDPISLLWVTEEFFYPYRPLDRLVIPGRLMVALLGVLLGSLVYRWAVDLFGHWAGLGALLWVTVDPNLLAHAGLATNDLAVTVGSLAALYTFWRLLHRPNVGRALLAGLALGLALSTKLNALLLLPAQGLLLLVFLLRPPRRHQPPSLHTIHYPLPFLLAVLAWLVAAFTLWAGYGFELRTLPGWPFPLPAGTHWLLLERVVEATGGGHPAFLMGRLSTTGWWYYFPLAFAIKTPLPVLFLLLAALVALVGGWQRRPLVDELALGGFVLLYTAATVYSRLNIGYRHILPILPLLAILAARLLTPTTRRLPSLLSRLPPTAYRLPLYALFLWQTIGTLSIWPFHLAFFNELVGGAEQGYRYLVDSNGDWGQNWKALHEYMEREGIDRVRLSTFVEYSAALDWYGVSYDPLPPLHAAPGVLPSRLNPPPGVYAISTTTLQGVLLADPGMYDWFRHREPDARIGHTLFVYRVGEPVRPAGWVAQCTVPAAPLTLAAVAEGLGRSDLRVAYFDCSRGWLFPTGGQQAGWYALFRATALAGDPFIDAQLAPFRLSFEQTNSGFLPPFALYEAAERTVAPQPAPGLPVRVGDLTLLGATWPDAPPYAPGQTVEVWTVWRVEALPARPLSLMMHLVGPGGAPVVVSDGLAVPIDTWQVGDVIVQRHALPLPVDAAPGEYLPQTGAYWLDTMERWSVMSGDVSPATQVDLAPVSVTVED